MLAASHRLYPIFISNDVILLSLRGPLVITSSLATSDVIRRSPKTFDSIYEIAIRDHGSKPPTPESTHIDSRQRH